MKFRVYRQSITEITNSILYSKARNYPEVSFEFSEEWEGVAKTAIFKTKTRVVNVVLDNDKCVFPWECLDETGIVYVSVFGGDLITTNTAKVFVGESGYEEGGVEPEPPEPSVYDQIMTLLGQCVKLDDSDISSQTTYSSQKIIELFSKVETFKAKVVTELPETGENGCMYFVKKAETGADCYDEWVWIEDDEKFEKVGSTTADISGKMDKVVGATPNNFASLNADGSVKDSGVNENSFLTEHQDISGKANKVVGGSTGNFVSLSISGDIADSGKKPSDFLTEHQDISGKVDKIDGKGLSTNDYTDEDKAKVDNIKPSGNMDYADSISSIPPIVEGMKGKTYTIGVEGDYVLDATQFYYVMLSWEHISKFDTTDFSGTPLETYDCSSSYDGVNIDDIFTMDRYDYIKALVDGYAAYDSSGNKLIDLPAGVDRSHKLGLRSYITKASDKTHLYKGDTIICDGEKWVVLHTSDVIDEFNLGSFKYIGKYGPYDAYEGCFEYDSSSSNWSGNKQFSLNSYISGYGTPVKIIDFSVVLKNTNGNFIKASMTGSGMDVSAFMNNVGTLSVYSSETIVDMFVTVKYIK